MLPSRPNDRPESELPRCTKTSPDIEDSIRDMPLTFIVLPSRPNNRDERELPRCTTSSIEDSLRAMPLTAIALPSRLNDRDERELPRCAKSSTDIEDSMREVPRFRGSRSGLSPIAVVICAI